MKRILSVLLACLMLLAFAACGSAGTSATPTAAPDGEPSGDAAKTLRVAMECQYAPYNWAQETDANGAVPIANSNQYAYGYDVMMAKKIAESLGYELEIVKLDWDSLIPALKSGDVDAVIAGQSITADRLEEVDFSTPYYYASIVTVVLEDSAYASAQGIADLSGGTCTSQLGTIWYNVCLGQIADADILPAQETAPTMLMALESGAVDYVVCDMPTAMAATQVYGDMRILDFTGTDGNFQVSDEEINLGISVQKGNTELLDAINTILATMTVSDYEEMMDEAISVQPLSLED